MELEERTTSSSRIGIACNECRRRKRKCDGERPVCVQCQKLSRPCTFPSGIQVRKRKYADDDYVRRLEDQVRAMRTIIKDANLHAENAFDEGYPPAMLGNNAMQEPDSPNDSHIANQKPESVSLMMCSPSKHETSQLALGELGSLMWKLSIGREGETSFTGPTCGFNFPEMSNPQKSSLGAAEGPELANMDGTVIYGHDTALKRRLRDCFAECLNPFHQFVQGSTLDSVDDFPFENLELQLLHSVIFATGAAFSQLTDSSKIALAFSSYAESIALSCCRKCPSILTVQGLTILAWHQLSQGLDGMAWTCLCLSPRLKHIAISDKISQAMAAGLIVHLGLHVTALDGLTEPSTLPSSKMLGPKIRTFWSFFLVDRISTATLGRNCTIPWRRIRVLDVCRTIPHGHATIEEIAFESQCKLWYLCDKFLDRIYSFEFHSLSKSEQHLLLSSGTDAIVTLFNCVDDRLKVKSSAACKVGILFQIAYHTILLLLHRPFIVRVGDATPVSLLAVQAVTEAANAMTHLIRIYYKTQTFVDAPVFLVHQVLSAAIVHLWNATSVNPAVQQQSSGKLSLCMKALEQLQVTWHDRGEKALLTIRVLAQRWGVIRALPMRFSHPLNTVSQATTVSANEARDLPLEMTALREFEGDSTSSYYQDSSYENYHGSLDTLADYNTIDASFGFSNFNFPYRALN